MGDRVAVLRKGLLQQVDAPQSLYEHPDNLFVAGFIGSPAMNLVQGALRVDGEATLTIGTQRITLDAKVLQERPALGSYTGRQVVVGVRPEDMEDASLLADSPADRRLRARASIVEALGAELLVHFEIDAPPVLTEDTKELAADRGTLDDLDQSAGAGTTEMVARVNPRSHASNDDPIELAVDTARAHFFDIDSGLAIRD